MLAQVGKKTGQLLQKMAALLADLVGMDTELAGDLSHRLFPFDGFQSDLAFLKAASWCLRMLTILPYVLAGYGRSKCTLLPCPVFGESLKKVYEAENNPGMFLYRCL
jgi:hypothetical protein